MLDLAAAALFAISPVPPTVNSKQTCDPIGRITHGSSANFRRGQVICSGNTISEPNNVQFLCFSNAALIPITGRSVVINESICNGDEAVATSPFRQCSRRGIISRLLCIVPKGPQDQLEQFQLIEPDAVSSNPRPTISWEAAAGTEFYTVSVSGADVDWQRTVNNATEIAYPPEEPSLTAGNAYEVIVVANSSTASLTASKVVNIREDGNSTISLLPR